MIEIGLNHYLGLSSLLFSLGIFGIFTNHRSVIKVLLSIELMLLGVNINLIAFSRFLDDLVGQIFVIFVLTVAAAEAGIGLAILVTYFRNKPSIQLDDIHELKG